MTPEMQAALGAPVQTHTGLLRIEMPEYTLRLCVGSAQLLYGGETYVGEDETFGVFASVSEIAEAVGDQAPNLQLTLLPPDASAASQLSQPGMQRSSVYLWLAVVDILSGTVVPDPDLLFAGTLDVVSLERRGGRRELDIQCVSVFEDLFQNEEGMRLSHAFHQSVWPGERGMENVTGTLLSKIWGPGDKPSGVTYTNSGYRG